MADCIRKREITGHWHLLMGGAQPPIKYTYQKILSLNQIKLLDISTSAPETQGTEPQFATGQQLAKFGMWDTRQKQIT